MERERVAAERMAEMQSKIHSQKRLFYKGGFSNKPLEQFNKMQHERSMEIERLGNAQQQRA